MSGQCIVADGSSATPTPDAVLAVVSFFSRRAGSTLSEIVLRERTRRLRRAEEQDWLSSDAA